MVMGFLARAPRSTRGASASTLALLPRAGSPDARRDGAVATLRGKHRERGRPASGRRRGARGTARRSKRRGCPRGFRAAPVSSGWRKPKRIASGPAASAPVAPARRANPTAGVASIPDSDPDSDPDDDALGPADERSLRRCRDALLASNERVARLRAERDAARADAEHLRSKMDDVTASWTRAIDAETVARADAREANRALDTTKHRVEELQRQLTRASAAKKAAEQSAETLKARLAQTETDLEDARDAAAASARRDDRDASEVSAALADRDAAVAAADARRARRRTTRERRRGARRGRRGARRGRRPPRGRGRRGGGLRAGFEPTRV